MPDLPRSRRLLAATLLAAVACGSKPPSPSTAPRPAAETSIPALRWVPADASYVLATARLSDGVPVLREAVTPIAIGFFGDLERLEEPLRAFLGVSMFSVNDLASIGLDPGGSAAIFGLEGMPTAVLEVADPDALHQFLDRTRPERNVAVTQVRGRELYTWHAPGDVAMSWIVMDGWFVVHVGLDSEGNGWIEPVLSSPTSRTIASADDFGRALERARLTAEGEEGTPGLVGLVRTAAAAQHWRAELSEPLGGCLRDLAEVVPRVIIGGAVGWDGGRGRIELELSESAAASLASSLAPAPPPGFRSYRDGAAIALGWAIDLAWLEGVLRSTGCPLLSELSTNFERPFASLGWGWGPRAVHAAAESLDIDDLDGRAAIHLALRDRTFVASRLDAIPGRSMFESTETIADRSVVSIGVPGFPAFLYELRDDHFTAAVGRDVMSRVLGPGPERDAGRTLAYVAIAPRRLGNLDELLEWVFSAMGWSYGARAAAQEISNRLGRYEEGRLRLVLEGRRLRVEGEMRLAR